MQVADTDTSIMQEARRLYRAVFSSGGHTDSHIWSRKSQNISFLRETIRNAKTPQELERRLNASDIYGIHCEDINVYERMLGWHVNLAIKHGILLATERFKTPSLLRCLIYCKEIQTKLGLANFNIVEIGGGNGKFARVAHETIGVQCIDVDIPESLYCAYVYLRTHLPDKRVLFIESPQMDFSLSDYDFILCPTKWVDCLYDKDITLAVNTHSLGEMNNADIRKWIDVIENKLSVRYFYGVNRFLNVFSGEEFRKDENEASVLFSDKWKVLDWELEPDFTRCPYEDSRAARCLKVFLQKTNKAQELPLNWLQEIQYEDWWRFNGQLPMHARIRGQLVHDFTQDGTLFKLWEAVRILKSYKAVHMMTKYLHHLSSEVFEEEFYYQNLLKDKL